MSINKYNQIQDTFNRPVRSSQTGGFFCPQSGTRHVHTYLIIVININIMSFNTKGRESNKTIRRAPCMNKRKLQLTRRLITCLNAALSHEGFVSVFINRSFIPRSEITLQIWEQACYKATFTLALVSHTTISDWCKDTKTRLLAKALQNGTPS